MQENFRMIKNRIWCVLMTLVESKLRKAIVYKTINSKKHEHKYIKHYEIFEKRENVMSTNPLNANPFKMIK